MSRLVIVTSDRDRICRLCEKPIDQGEAAYVFRGVHVPPKRRDLHMHINCLMCEIQMAEATKPASTATTTKE